VIKDKRVFRAAYACLKISRDLTGGVDAGDRGERTPLRVDCRNVSVVVNEAMLDIAIAVDPSDLSCIIYLGRIRVDSAGNIDNGVVSFVVQEACS
jgi:hypothetical protein